MPFAWNALDAPLSGSMLGVISLLPLPSTFSDHPPGAHSPWHPLPSTAKSITQYQGLPRPTSASPASASRAVASAALSLHHQCRTQAGHRAGTWQGLVVGNSEGKEAPQAAFPSWCFPPKLRAARRESGSRCPWLGEAAPQPECCSVCAQTVPARPGLPWSCPAA